MTNLLDTLIATFGDSLVQQAEPRYLQEPRGRYQSAPMPLLLPRSTQEVSDIVRFCNTQKIGLIPYGGGTGLVGGQVMEGAENTILLSLERMNAIRDIRADENSMTVEAGVILERIQAAADDIDRLFPLALASQGSCQIGGNLATNAGGVQVLRYGNTRDLCLGIEAVMPDGSIFNGLKSLRKDNTGYDLRHLLIGSEGSLGIITAACLKLFPKPARKTTAMLVVQSPDAALTLLSNLNADMNGAVSAFELMHRQGTDFLIEKMPQVRLPFSDIPEWSVLVEVSGGAGEGLDDRFMTSLEAAINDELVLDALVAQSVGQAQEFWDVRENIPEANRLIGSISSHDISIPISRIPEFIEKTPALIDALGDLRINCFGHLGDGNLHYNVFPPKDGDKADYVDIRGDIKRVIHDQTHAFGGSVSAEHGIGRLKTKDLETYGDPTKLAVMQAIKAALDPNGIMNPGAVIAKN